MSSRSSVDRAPPRCPGGHGFDSFGNSDFFLCPTLVSCLSIQLSHFISDIFIHLQFFIYLFQENSDSSKEGANHSSSNLTCACEHSTSLPKAASSPCLVDHSTALVNAGSLTKLWQRSQADVPGACGGNAGTSPVSLKDRVQRTPAESLLKITSSGTGVVCYSFVSERYSATSAVPCRAVTIKYY